ncbi:MAG: hypothetical protein ACKN9W_10170 [Methylococcus sp.]
MNPQRIAELFLSLLPEDGAFISNTALGRDLEARLKAEGFTLTEDDYWSVHAALIGEGILLKGQGRGGRVRRNVAQGGENFELTETTVNPVIEKPQPAAQPKPTVRAYLGKMVVKAGIEKPITP